MGGRPRDEDVKEEPDEDEAAMLGEREREQLEGATVTGLGRGWRRSYHGLGHARGEEAGSPAGLTG